jgi:hypothetical protein
MTALADTTSYQRLAKERLGFGSAGLLLADALSRALSEASACRCPRAGSLPVRPCSGMTLEK